MYDVIALPHTEYQFRVVAEPGVLEEISENFTFLVDNYQHQPLFKAGVWDGKIRLFTAKKPYLLKGLYLEFHEFCKSRNYKIATPQGSILPTNAKEIMGNSEGLKDWVRAVKTESLEERDYQMDSFVLLLALERAICLSSTSSGKSFMIYLLSRYYSEMLGKPTLIMTNRINLVEQMRKDLKSYAGKQDDFGVDIMKSGHNINSVPEEVGAVVSTWQSAVKKDSDWFEQFGAIIADEVHGWDGKSCMSIMEKAFMVKYRYGFTGTLDGSKINKMVLTGLFGPVKLISTTKQRIDAGDTAGLKIKCLRLIYHEKDRKLISKKTFNPALKKMIKTTYQDEVNFVIKHDKRIEFIVKLVKSLKGNTLVLFNRNDDFGKPLHQKFLDAGIESTLIYGISEVEEREQARYLIENNNNITITASIGTFSEGMSVNNLHNIVTVYPMKGRIKVLQSIGRGLRKAKDKTHCNYFDIVDDLRYYKDQDNHLWKHGLIRCSIYDQEQFEYEWFDYNLKEQSKAN